MVIFFAFVFGCCIGSFCNVIISRVPCGESVIKGRSHCPTCEKRLRAIDMIPLLSYFNLKGRCRYCAVSIGFRHFLVELTGGIIGMLCVMFCKDYGEASFIYALAMLLLCITVTDIETMLIPNAFVISLAVLAVIALFLFPEISVISRVVGMTAVSLFMLVLSLIVQGAFGGGDIKLMMAAGFLLGVVNTFIAFFLAAIIGAIAGIMLKLSNHQAKQIAFGPFLAIGIIIAFLFGNPLFSWYFQIVGK